MIDLMAFTNRIKQTIYDKMPLESDIDFLAKHKNRNGRMRDSALGSNNIISLPNGNKVFEIGNDDAEVNYPYYHILEDAQVIHKRNMGTKASKGSQDNISIYANRDYGIMTLGNSGNVYNEYRKNVRGKRSLVGKATSKHIGKNGRVYIRNKNSNIYENIHYHYIEKILDTYLDSISNEFGLKQRRKSIDNEIMDILPY